MFVVYHRLDMISRYVVIHLIMLHVDPYWWTHSTFYWLRFCHCSLHCVVFNAFHQFFEEFVLEPAYFDYNFICPNCLGDLFWENRLGFSRQTFAYTPTPIHTHTDTHTIPIEECLANLICHKQTVWLSWTVCFCHKYTQIHNFVITCCHCK